jgi:hypothetical protein
MWRAITYGNKATIWCVCSSTAQRLGNKLFGLGMWTLEYKQRGS